jgi:hypothetical protein
MEVIKVQLARTIWLFDIQELNPRGVSLYPEIYSGFAKRYQFTELPKPEDIRTNASLYFKNGKFVYDSSVVSIDFDMHGDGAVASCRHSTEAAHDFLLDCTKWIGEQLGIIYSPSLMKKRIYRDEIIVQLKANLDKVSDKVHKFCGLLTTASGKNIQPTGLLFGEDGGASAILTLDRRINTSWEENKYFSTSTLQTAQHIDALAKFEILMAE